MRLLTEKGCKVSFDNKEIITHLFTRKVEALTDVYSSLRNMCILVRGLFLKLCTELKNLAIKFFLGCVTNYSKSFLQSMVLNTNQCVFVGLWLTARISVYFLVASNFYEQM